MADKRNSERFKLGELNNTIEDFYYTLGSMLELVLEVLPHNLKMINSSIRRFNIDPRSWQKKYTKF